MNFSTPPNAVTLSISAVERDTGLTKDTLRVWERRYGFPTPARDPVGERAYPLEQVEKLRLVKRLLDAGHRPGRVVAMGVDDLQRLADTTPDPRQSAVQPALDEVAVQAYLAIVRQHDVPALRQRFMRDMLRFGLQRFVLEVLSPLNTAIGDAWLRGQLQVFEEHAYTESVQLALRHAIADIPASAMAARPRLLLATVPGEPHGLGLLMVETLAALEGAACVSLGVQTPVWDIVLAARAYRSDIVALGFTGCTNPNQTVDALTELRGKLPPQVDLWVGGAAPVLQRRRIEGVLPFDDVDGVPAALQAWRLSHGIPSDS
jgi:methanogenic corrinoid protein MtbC1